MELNIIIINNIFIFNQSNIYKIINNFINNKLIIFY